MFFIVPRVCLAHTSYSCCSCSFYINLSLSLVFHVFLHDVLSILKGSSLFSSVVLMFLFYFVFQANGDVDRGVRMLSASGRAQPGALFLIASLTCALAAQADLACAFAHATLATAAPSCHRICTFGAAMRGSFLCIVSLLRFVCVLGRSCFIIIFGLATHVVTQSR